MMGLLRKGLGWIPDYPDFRDYTEGTKDVREILEPTGFAARPQAGGSKLAGAPTAKDLREWASPVEDQGALGSCTAQAGAGVIEYYERKSFGRHVEASRLFLYKVARNLMKIKGDTGAYLRLIMGAMVLFGVPPEEYWPYTDDEHEFDKEPPAFCYAFAQNYKTLKYYRHDPPAVTRPDVMDRLKAYLAAGHPAMFGFTVYSSVEQAALVFRPVKYRKLQKI
jgi:C1A family cysteine protease